MTLVNRLTLFAASHTSNTSSPFVFSFCNYVINLLSYSTNNIRYLLNSLLTLTVPYSSHSVKLGCLFILFCHFCLISLQLSTRPCTFPPAHWRLILLIHDFSLVIEGKLHPEYLGFSLLVANYSRKIPFFLHWRPGCRHIPGCVRIPNRTKNTETTAESAEIPKRPLNRPENTETATESAREYKIGPKIRKSLS